MKGFNQNTSQSSIQDSMSANGVAYDKESMLVQYQYKDFVIQVSESIVLLVKCIKQTNLKISASTRLQYKNGSSLFLPIQYKSYFQQLFPKSQKIAYNLRSEIDYFSVNLKLFLNSFDSNTEFQQQDKLLIQQIIEKIKNALQFFGIVNTKSRSSLKLLIKTMQAKKRIFDSVKNNKEVNKSKMEEEAPYQQNSIFQVLQIKQLNQDVNQFHKGGYFIIEKKIADIIGYDGITLKHQALALKKIISSELMQEKLRKKIQKQLNIIKKIKKNKYLVNYYYVSEESQFQFYMDYLPKNLKEILHERRIKIKQIFNFSKQLIEAVSILHQYGVVHRDLKLQNIMVDANTGLLKIIDFGESTFIGQQFISKHNLGCTIPYSPIQCLFDIPEGYNKPQIDLWSTSIIIYELAFRGLPIYYNKNIQQQIMSGWRTQGDFDPCFKLRPKRGIRKMQQLLSFMSQQGLRITQSQRLQLHTLNQIIKAMEAYHDYFTAIINN